MQIMSRRGAHLQKDYIQNVVGGGDDERMVTGQALIKFRLAQENLGPRLRENRNGMVVRFPESTYAGHCEVFINDMNLDIVARNAILLLIALNFSPDVATPIMLHTWYSALVPAEMLRSLQNSVLPLIQEVCKKIQAKPAQSLLSKTWTFWYTIVAPSPR